MTKKSYIMVLASVLSSKHGVHKATRSSYCDDYVRHNVSQVFNMVLMYNRCVIIMVPVGALLLLLLLLTFTESCRSDEWMHSTELSSRPWAQISGVSQWLDHNTA